VEALWFRAEHREVMVTPDHDFGADVVARMVFAISLSVNAASYVYSYEGSNYDFAGGPLFNNSMSVNGYFELEAPLEPGLNMFDVRPFPFSFSNGLQTLTDTTTTTTSEIKVSTTQAGEIYDWSINLRESLPDELTLGDRYYRISSTPNSDDTFYADYGGKTGSGLNVFLIVAQAYSFIQTGKWTLMVIPAIDIKPNNRSDDVIDLKNEKQLKVIIFGDETFDALQIIPETVKFGVTGTEASPIRSKGHDYDRDGDSDLILTFRSIETGIGCGDTEAVLIGQTYADPTVTIKGTDSLSVTCK
jgi:hypothetical protein